MHLNPSREQFTTTTLAPKQFVAIKCQACGQTSDQQYWGTSTLATTGGTTISYDEYQCPKCGALNKASK